MKTFIKLGSLAAFFGASIATQAQLIDQITGATLGPGGYASQEFEPANAAFHINAIDDFNIPGTSPGYNITSIDAGMLMFGGAAGTRAWTNVTGWRVEFYSSLASAGVSLTGSAASRTVGTGGIVLPAGDLAGIINIPFSTVTLGPGTYWVGVMPIMAFGGGFGQTGVQESAGGPGPNGLNAYQANPGGGFAFAGPPPGTNLIGGATGPNKNLAYRLNGTIVPEPGTFIAIGLGVAGLLVARRRRKA